MLGSGCVFQPGIGPFYRVFRRKTDILCNVQALQVAYCVEEKQLLCGMLSHTPKVDCSPGNYKTPLQLLPPIALSPTKIFILKIIEKNIHAPPPMTQPRG